MTFGHGVYFTLLCPMVYDQPELSLGLSHVRVFVFFTPILKFTYIPILVLLRHCLSRPLFLVFLSLRTLLLDPRLRTGPDRRGVRRETETPEVKRVHSLSTRSNEDVRKGEDLALSTGT